MKSIAVIFLIIPLSILQTNAQSLYKVKGARNLGAVVGLSPTGETIGIEYNSFFKKNQGLVLKGAFENSKASLTSYHSFLLSSGYSYSLKGPFPRLFFNVPVLFNIGAANIDNEYFSSRLDFIFGSSIEPNLEVFITKKASMSLGFSQHIDFSNEFRNYHYSINIALKTLIN